MQARDLERGLALYLSGKRLREAARKGRCDEHRLRALLAQRGELRQTTHESGAWSSEAGKERIALLRELAAQELPASKIANVLTDRFGRRVTRNAVIAKMHRLGIKNHSNAQHNPAPPRGGPGYDNNAGCADKIALAGQPDARPEKNREKPEAKKEKPPNLASAPALQLDPMPETGFTLEDLKPRMCRFPLGDVLDPARFFCGEKMADDGSSYCARHAAIAKRRISRRTA